MLENEKLIHEELKKTKITILKLESELYQTRYDLSKTKSELQEYTKTLEDTLEQSTTQLRRKDLDLHMAHEELQRTNSELLQLTIELDDRVEARTAELTKANLHLTKEIDNRKKVEVKLQNLYDELKSSQAQLIHAEKMTALGMMIAGIAHELNNPMMGILNFVQYCVRKTEKDDVRYSVLKDSEREVLRCIDLVKNLLTFSRMGKHNEERFENEKCETLIERVIQFLKYKIEKMSITLEKNFCQNAPAIPMKTNTMQQVFLNIIGNALDAMVSSKEKKLTLAVTSAGDFQKILISDTGVGMNDEEIMRIFDPFYTTKPVGQGTGLGLSLSLRMVQEHNGSIVCNSKKGEGTSFEILLPVNREKV